MIETSTQEAGGKTGGGLSEIETEEEAGDKMGGGSSEIETDKNAQETLSAYAGF